MLWWRWRWRVALLRLRLPWSTGLLLLIWLPALLWGCRTAFFSTTTEWPPPASITIIHSRWHLACCRREIPRRIIELLRNDLQLSGDMVEVT